MESIIGLKELVEARIFEDEKEALEEAIRQLLRHRRDVRIRLAIHRYRNEDISLGKAAEIAGVSWDEMKDLLLEHGIAPRLGPQSMDELKEEIEAIEGYFANEGE